MEKRLFRLIAQVRVEAANASYRNVASFSRKKISRFGSTGKFNWKWDGRLLQIAHYGLYWVWVGTRQKVGERLKELTSCIPLNAGVESKSLEWGRSGRWGSLGGCLDGAAGWWMFEACCWATWCICFCWYFCCFFSSFLSSKTFSLDPARSKSFSLSFEDCLWFFDSLRVAPRSADALPALATAIRSRLETDAEDLMPTEWDGDTWWVCCFDDDPVADGFPLWPLRNSDFNFIILTMRSCLHFAQENISVQQCFFSLKYDFRRFLSSWCSSAVYCNESNYLLFTFLDIACIVAQLVNRQHRFFTLKFNKLIPSPTKFHSAAVCDYQLDLRAQLEAEWRFITDHHQFDGSFSHFLLFEQIAVKKKLFSIELCAKREGKKMKTLHHSHD